MSSARRRAAQTMRRSRTTILTVTVDDFAKLDDSPDILRDAVQSEVGQARRVQSIEDEARFALDSADSIQFEAPDTLDEFEWTLEDPASTGDHYPLDQFTQGDK